MKEIQDAILAMGGCLKRESLTLLCLAIENARRSQPFMPQMKAICINVGSRAGRKPGTVSKALERAVDKLWQTGDREVLATYRRGWLYDRPTPKEFVAVVAQRLWDGVERTAEPVG